MSACKLFRNDGTSGFTDVTSAPLNVSGPAMSAAWVDYDLDGDLDLYIVNYGTPNKLLRNDGTRFTDVTAGPLADAGWGVACAWGDYDNDGDPDLYITNDGPNRLLRNDGGVFTRIPGLYIEDGGPGQGAAWCDYDNDGDLDLYVANYGTPNKLIRNDGGNVFTWVTAGPLGDPSNSTGVAWGDYDNDGDFDLFVSNYGQPNKLLRNDGGGVFTAITSAPFGDAGNGTGAAWADFDLDGDLDLYVVQDGTGNMLLRNDLTASRHWLDLRLVGRVSSKDAIGARVRVVSGGRSQIQEVSGGSGYMSQSSLTLHFGLGSSTSAESVIVSWPSGYVEAYLAVAVDRLITLTELDVTAVSEDPVGKAPRFELSAPSPNPVRAGARFRYALPVAAHARLRIFDVRGRLVVTLVDDVLRAGWHEAAWARRDAHGHPVASGVYVARIEALGESRVRKLVLVP
jgi:hypothetical protein